MAREFTDQELAKRKKLAELIEKNKNPFEYKKFARNYNSVSFVKEFENHSKEELHENKTQILIAGRVMAIRQTFGVIKDFYGKVQFYINKKTINPQT
jgi:lysyl-tRNA synthetase class 2